MRQDHEHRHPVRKPSSRIAAGDGPRYARPDDPMSDPGNKRERELILARRRFFVASALAGVVSACEQPAAQPCLNVAIPLRDAGARPTPVPSTSDSAMVAPPPPPEVCLEVAQPPPQVCLEFAEPPKDSQKKP